MPPAEWPPDRLDALNRLTTVARLLSTAVHETGNALQVMSGHAELLESRPDDSEKTKLRARTIKAHADQAAVRLRGLVALANAPAGPPRRLDLTALAERTLDLRRYSLSRARITVAVEGDTGVAVTGDEVTLLRLVANLLLHAEDAVKGRPAPSIRLRVTQVGTSAMLMVTDSGEPLTPDQQSQLFVPFADPNDPGCGLVVARQLAETMGGTVAGDFSRADGTTLVLTLPAAR